jgi:hypothetical protein
MTAFNPKPVEIKLSREEIAELYNYLVKCDAEGFSGINNFKNHARDREFMYHFILKDILFKVFSKSFTLLTTQNKSFRIKVSQIEQKTLSVMFQRVDCTPFMLTVQEKFINQLQKLN